MRLQIAVLTVSLLSLFAFAAHGQDANQRAMEAMRAGDGAAAVAIWEEAAAGGDFPAQISLGSIYTGMSEQMTGVAADLERARYWMGKAVEQRELALANNMPDALKNMAVMIRDGVFSEPDAAEAVQWYFIATNLGDANAGIEIGKLYEKGGPGLAPDIESARVWFDWAAQAGPNEQYEAARFHIDQGDYGRALHWLDALYLTAKDSESWQRLYDPLLHRAYEPLFPAPAPGWVVGDVSHQTYDAKRGSDGRIIHPVRLARTYENAAAGQSIRLLIALNDEEYEGIPETIQSIADGVLADNPVLAETGAAVAGEMGLTQIQGRQAILPKADSQGNTRMMIHASAVGVVEILDLAGKDPEGTAIRALADSMDLDRTMTALAKHGLYITAVNGSALKEAIQ